MEGRLKQVIVIRRDLRMRRGKEIAQGSHASMAFLVERITRVVASGEDRDVRIELSVEELEWVSGGRMAKVVLQAPDLETLERVRDEASARSLAVHVITDLGLTEFGGVPTVTALAIGPADADEIDRVTGPGGVVPLALY